MTNRKRFDNLSNAELAKILVKEEWCDGCEGCALKICSTEECVELVRMWLEGKCKDNPPADKHVDLQRVSVGVCDNVNHPTHYTSGKIEVIDFIEDKELGFHLGNAVKYISRAGRKNPDKIVEDLQKAVWYINREISRLEGMKNDGK